MNLASLDEAYVGIHDLHPDNGRDERDGRYKVVEDDVG